MTLLRKITNDWHSSEWLLPLVIMVLGVMAYANTFDVPLIFDDTHYISENPAVKDFRYYFDPALAERAIAQGRLDQNFRTRMVAVFTFALNYRSHGLNVWGYHEINLLLHLFNGLLVYSLARSIFRTPLFINAKKDAPAVAATSSWALLVALFFIAHPIQTQAVTYLSQRFTSLATMFYLSALLLYGGWRMAGSEKMEGRKRTWSNGGKIAKSALYLSAIISTVLAMFTKEIAFTLPLVIALYEFMFFSGSLLKRFWPLVPFVATMVIIPSVIFGAGAKYEDVMRLSASRSGDLAEAPVITTYLFTQFRVIVTYLRLLFLPINQNVDYDYPRYTEFFQPPVIFSFLILLMMVAAAGYLYYRSTKVPADRGIWLRLTSFGICWFFLTLSVESSLMPLHDVIFEHRIYLPSVGFFIALLAIMEIGRKRLCDWQARGVGILLFAVVVMLSFATHERNRLWKDPANLWEDAVRKSPAKSRPHNNLAKEYQQRGRFDDAVSHYQKALLLTESSPTSASIIPYNGLEEIYRIRGENELLERQYKSYLCFLLQARDKSKEFEQTWLNELGIVYARMKRWREAEETFHRGVKLGGNLSKPYMNLGNCYLKQNKVDEALSSMQQAVKLDPDDDSVQQSLGDVLVVKGDYAAALNAYLTSAALNQDSPRIYRKIAKQYISLGDYEKAGMVLQKAVDIRPDDPIAYNDLGVYYFEMKRFDEAEKAYLRAIQLGGLNAMVLHNLGKLYVNYGKFDNGLACLQQAVSLAPMIPEFYASLGWAYGKNGDYSRSIESYEKVLSLSPQDATAKNNLEHMQQLVKEVDKSKESLKK